jgi:hypothetical protein
MHVVHAKSDYMDRDPSSSEYSVSSAVLNGITNESTIVEMLARFVTNNAAYLKSLGMDADVHGNNVQDSSLNAALWNQKRTFVSRAKNVHGSSRVAVRRFRAERT